MIEIKQIMVDACKKTFNEHSIMSNETFLSLLTSYAYRKLETPISILEDIEQLLTEEINFKKTYLGEIMSKSEIFDKFCNLLSTFYLVVDVANSVENTMNTISREE